MPKLVCQNWMDTNPICNGKIKMFAKQKEYKFYVVKHSIFSSKITSDYITFININYINYNKGQHFKNILRT